MFWAFVDFVEWFCGAVALTTIGTILVLKDLTSFGQWVVIILLYAFLIATGINRFKEGWLRRKPCQPPKK